MNDPVKGWSARRPSTALDLADHLRLLIIGGELPEGSRLPPQDTFAARLGVARSILRDALSQLEALGYVETRRGRSGGSFVLSPTERADRILAGGFGIEDVRAAYEYRIAVEGHACRLAAEHRSETDLADLADSVGLDPDAGLPLVQFRSADARFHMGVAEAARNPYLVEAVRHARAEVFLRTDRLWFVRDTGSMITDHREILEAVRDRDPAAAADLMVRHLRQSLTTWEAIARG